MVFTQNVVPNLVDHARVSDPDGAIAKIAWLLSQSNAIIKDSIWHEGNLPTGHKVTLNTALPQGTWRNLNQGVAASKPLNTQVQFNIGELVGYSMVDKTLANLGGNVGDFRWVEDQAHLEGMSQQMATAMFYANEATTPSEFTGLVPYYNSLSASIPASKNVISCGGSGSSNTSIWMLGMGDNTIFNIYPKGVPAGLQYEDKGDVTPLYDSNGNRYEGYTSYFAWRAGLVVKDWRYGVRICNIDTTTAGLAGTTPPDLNIKLIDAAALMPVSPERLFGVTDSDAPGDPVPGVVHRIYMNRTGRVGLDTQAIRDKNVLIGMREYAGQSVLDWRGIRTEVCDTILNSETAVS